MDKLIAVLDIEQILTNAVGFLPRLGIAVLILTAFWIFFVSQGVH
jgi:hypothetical protein